MSENLEWLKIYKKIKDIDLFLGIFAKFIPLAIAYGGWQLLAFSRNYQIPFLELAKSEVMLTYGVLSLVMICFIGVFPVFIVFLGHMSGRRFYRVWIINSRIKLVYEHPLWSSISIAAIMSTWPMVLLSSTYYTLVLGYPVALLLAMLLTSRLTAGYNRRVRKYRIGNVISLAITSGLSMIFSVGLFYLMYNFLKNTFESLPEIIFYSLLCVVYFVLYFMTMYWSIKKKNHRDIIYFYFVMIVLSLFYISIIQPKILIDKVASAAGFGNVQTCYLAKDLRDAGVPEYFLNPTSRREIVKIDVIAKINNAYYFSKISESSTPPRIRIVSDSFKAISCPVDSVAQVSVK
ncbi:hypothetical protein QQF21_01675 [Lelliottia sp. V89_10]|uniref:hypothetical protein n=1 Tax=Lelliottia wanjuensis TaxID=3050585 RepID=UPI00249E6D32|nr:MULTISPECIES: hypothetical protein [unclassified Lelliottia]MDI3360837.1 hypothetical protein [Lelliottia sp. V89_13]MDK9547338.1 hypothetical protein [Lelliottia sp. V89_5]MDK9594318.1 hypothetical protein [Lelliottia sp. V89_10]